MNYTTRLRRLETTMAPAEEPPQQPVLLVVRTMQEAAAIQPWDARWKVDLAKLRPDSIRPFGETVAVDAADTLAHGAIWRMRRGHVVTATPVEKPEPPQPTPPPPAPVGEPATTDPASAGKPRRRY